MQGLGTINNEYTILSEINYEGIRNSYLARYNQTQILLIIEFKKYEHNNFSLNDINILNLLNNANFFYIENGTKLFTLNYL